MSKDIIQQITDGRTDLVFDFLAAGHAATSADKDGTRLIEWCAYYGDVRAINGRLLIRFSQSNYRKGHEVGAPRGRKGGACFQPPTQDKRAQRPSFLARDRKSVV